MLSWNVRGANDNDKRKVIKALIKKNKVDLVCLQKTKIQEMSRSLIRSLRVGRYGLKGCCWRYSGFFGITGCWSWSIRK